LNVDPSPSRFPVDEETRAAILRYNSLDVELYRRAVDRLLVVTST